jgi:hypothetical protein
LTHINVVAGFKYAAPLARLVKLETGLSLFQVAADCFFAKAKRFS